MSEKDTGTFLESLTLLVTATAETGECCYRVSKMVLGMHNVDWNRLEDSLPIRNCELLNAVGRTLDRSNFEGFRGPTQNNPYHYCVFVISRPKSQFEYTYIPQRVPERLDGLNWIFKASFAAYWNMRKKSKESWRYEEAVREVYSRRLELLKRGTMNDFRGVRKRIRNGECWSKLSSTIRQIIRHNSQSRFRWIKKRVIQVFDIRRAGILGSWV